MTLLKVVAIIPRIGAGRLEFCLQKVGKTTTGESMDIVRPLTVDLSLESAMAERHSRLTKAISTELGIPGRLGSKEVGPFTCRDIYHVGLCAPQIVFRNPLPENYGWYAMSALQNRRGCLFDREDDLHIGTTCVFETADEALNTYLKLKRDYFGVNIPFGLQCPDLRQPAL